MPKFYVRNAFTYDGVDKIKDDIIEVSADKITVLRAANVLGASVKETIIETAVIKPVENEMVNRKVIKRVKK